jgi:hypothetical protein
MGAKVIIEFRSELSDSIIESRDWFCVPRVGELVQLRDCQKFFVKTVTYVDGPSEHHGGDSASDIFHVQIEVSRTY